MTSLTITRGLPASGKTTHARAWVLEDPANRVRINRDDMRNMLKVTSGPTIMGSKCEQALTDAIRAAVLAFTSAGQDVVCDDTNLRPKYVREWRRWALAHGLEFNIEEFDIDIDESIIRDAGRDKPVGEGVIRRMGNYLVKGRLAPIRDEEETPAPEVYAPGLNLPEAIIVDIDGTVALMNGRSPYDLTRVGEDLPNRPVIQAVWGAESLGFEIIFCSGREDVARDDTVQWIKNHIDVPVDHLYMRPAGDMRKDAIVKRELFDKYIRHNFNVRYVLDDRNQVVTMWRDLGLTCLQCAPGDF